MNKLLFQLFLFFILFYFIKLEEKSDVIILNKNNFEQLTQEGKWFLEFYAPWCGYCKKLAPIYEKIATQLKGSIFVGKINCDEEKELCNRFSIRGYPTIKFLSENILYNYQNQRTEEELIKFAKGEYIHAEISPFPNKENNNQDYSNKKEATLLSFLKENFEKFQWEITIGIIILLMILFIGLILLIISSSSSSSSSTPTPIIKKQD